MDDEQEYISKIEALQFRVLGLQKKIIIMNEVKLNALHILCDRGRICYCNDVERMLIGSDDG